MTNFDKQSSRDRIDQQNLNQTQLNQPTYRDGYNQGRLSEQQYYEADRRARDDENAAGGLVLGMLLTALIALGVGAYYFLNSNRPPATFGPVTVPQTSPAPTQSPQIQERVIERDRVVPVPVPVPQQQAPAPNVNITVPDTSERAPASPAPVQPSNQGAADTTQPPSNQ